MYQTSMCVFDNQEYKLDDISSRGALAAGLIMLKGSETEIGIEAGLDDWHFFT